MPPPPAPSSAPPADAASSAPPDAVSSVPAPLTEALEPPPPGGGPAIDVRNLPWPERLAFFVDMMRDLSRQTKPQDMVRTYGKRMRQVMPSDASVSLSRRGLEAPWFRITRSNKFQDPVDPWKQQDKLPLLSGGLLADLLYGNEPATFDDFDPDPADPAYPYVSGHKSMIAIPLFDGGEAINMVLLLRAEPGGFDPDKLPEHVWMSNLFGRAASNLVLAEQVKEKAIAAKAAAAEAREARDAAQAARDAAQAAEEEARAAQAEAERSQAAAERAYDAVDRELKAVADIQRSLLPAELPDIPGLDVAAYYQTSTRAGGDYYDFFPLPSGRWGILVADVSG
ncbi:MAG: hypothetical protein JWO31_659, partial [Phycisphaerales bacterium]|nr:hypothetical protein [Phycisphaerales bacterium]